MDEARGSDISKTQLDLVDLSESEHSQFAAALSADDDDSLHPSIPKGFCVKEFEERMQSLQKENFNLKLRIYFLEDKNQNIPEGAELLYKQNIDYKVSANDLLRFLTTLILANFRWKMKISTEIYKKSKTCCVKHPRRWSCSTRRKVPNCSVRP